VKGWDWQHHATRKEVFGQGAQVEDNGYAFGLRYVLPLGSRTRPWVRGGGLFNHVEIRESWDGEPLADSEHTLGVEVAGGLDVTLSGPWSLTPGVRYRRFEPTVRSGGVEATSTLSDVTFDLGVMLRF
jgi:opacity protein-like surface antigen